MPCVVKVGGVDDQRHQKAWCRCVAIAQGGFRVGCQSLFGDLHFANAAEHVKKTEYNWFEGEVVEGTADDTADEDNDYKEIKNLVNSVLGNEDETTTMLMMTMSAVKSKAVAERTFSPVFEETTTTATLTTTTKN